MSGPHLLVVEGNTPAGRARHIAAGGVPMHETYTRMLQTIAPDATIDVCFPADGGATLPDGIGLESYDGVALTGSALNIYDRAPEVDRQIELARATFASGTPLFGSCWGLQVITVAAGGAVRRNPKGVEIGISRRIRVTLRGREHSLYKEKPETFDAFTIHFDEVESLPAGTQVLGTNGMSNVQAAEVPSGKGVAWGVQYHPEFTPKTMAACIRRVAPLLVRDGLLTGEQDAASVIGDLESLDRDSGLSAPAWRLGIDSCVLDEKCRTREVRNWVDAQVLPKRIARGRA